MSPTPAPTVLLRSEESAGQLAVVDLGLGGGRRSTGTTSDETFYILEGELTFQLGDVKRILVAPSNAGALAWSGVGRSRPNC